MQLQFFSPLDLLGVSFILILKYCMHEKRSSSRPLLYSELCFDKFMEESLLELRSVFCVCCSSLVENLGEVEFGICTCVSVGCHFYYRLSASCLSTSSKLEMSMNTIHLRRFSLLNCVICCPVVTQYFILSTADE